MGFNSAFKGLIHFAGDGHTCIRNMYEFCFVFFWCVSPLVGLDLLLIHEDFCGF